MRLILLIILPFILFSCNLKEKNSEDITNEDRYKNEELQVINEIWDTLINKDYCLTDTINCDIFICDSLVHLDQFLIDRIKKDSPIAFYGDTNRIRLVNTLLNITSVRKFDFSKINLKKGFNMHFGNPEQSKKKITFSRIAFNSNYTKGVFCFILKYLSNQYANFGRANLIFICKRDNKWKIESYVNIWEDLSE